MDLTVTNLLEAFKPEQRRIPRGHGTVSGQWTREGSIKWSEGLEASYRNVRPQLEKIVYGFCGKPGDTVSASPDEISETERIKLMATCVENSHLDKDLVRIGHSNARAKIAQQVWSHGTDPKDPDHPGYGMRPELMAKAKKEYGEDRASVGHPTQPLSWVGSELGNLLRVEIEKFVEEAVLTPAGKRIIANAIREAAETEYSLLGTEELCAKASELGVLLPKRTVGAWIPWDALSGRQKNWVETKILDDTPPTEDQLKRATAAAKAAYLQGAVTDQILETWNPHKKDFWDSAAKYGITPPSDSYYDENDNLVIPRDRTTLSVGDEAIRVDKDKFHQRALEEYARKVVRTDGDEIFGNLVKATPGGFDEVIRSNLYEVRYHDLRKLPPEEKLETVNKLGIAIPIYSREPGKYRPFSDVAASDEEQEEESGKPGIAKGSPIRSDYNKTRAVALKLQSQRTIDLAQSMGILLTPKMLEKLGREIWGGWKHDSGSSSGIALQESCRDVLGAAHRTTDARKKAGELGCYGAAVELLGEENLREISARSFAEQNWQKRSKEFQKDANGHVSMPPPKNANEAYDRIMRGGLCDTLAEDFELKHERSVGVSYGQKVVAAYTRATWEASQYILDKAGIRDQLHPTYRALILDEDAVYSGNPEGISGDGQPLGQYKKDHPDPNQAGVLVHLKNLKVDISGGNSPLVKLTSFHNVPNGCQSTSRKLNVPNEWSGAGGVRLEPGRNARVVLRMLVPSVAVLSLPCFGQNVYGEQELVVTGNAWAGLDAWVWQAPAIEGYDHPEFVQAVSSYYKKHGTLKGLKSSFPHDSPTGLYGMPSYFFET